MRYFKQRLRDCFLQEWRSILISSNRFAFYRTFKTTFEGESYSSCINIKKFRDTFVRFRMGCNELRSNFRSRHDPNFTLNCPFCNEVENENHLLRHCPLYCDIRQKYLAKYLPNSDSMNLSHLINGKDADKTKNVAMYIFYAFKLRSHKIQELDSIS